MLGRSWEAGEAQYFYSTRKGGFRRVSIDGARLAEHRLDFERLLAGFADAIHGGTYPAQPHEWNCKWCDYQRLCPAVADHKAQMERKREDPRVAALSTLQEIQ